jgi:ankyrin repeat protein
MYVNRQSVFISAAYDGQTIRMRAMYALGVDVNAPACQHRRCYNPIVAAGWGGHPAAIQYLLDRGADINKSGKFGKTALMMAAYRGDSDSVALLLSRGADVNTKDRDGSSALSLAKQEGYRETIDLLRRAGAKEDP